MAVDPLDEQLSSADPLRLGPDVDSALHALREEILAMPAISRSLPSRSKRIVVALGATAVFGVGVGAAAADGHLFSARTGEHGRGEEVGTSELIDVDAADAPEVIREITMDVPLPPGGSLEGWIEDVPDETDVWAEEGILSGAMFIASCQWAAYWLDAQASGDRVAQAEASAVLDEIPTWRAVVATDGGGIVRMHQRIADAARRGDPQALRDAGYQVNCTDHETGQVVYPATAE